AGAGNGSAGSLAFQPARRRYSSYKAPQITSWRNSFSTRSRPAEPCRRRRSGSSRYRATAAARVGASPGGTSVPVTPSATASTQPPAPPPPYPAPAAPQTQRPVRPAGYRSEAGSTGGHRDQSVRG